MICGKDVDYDLVATDPSVAEDLADTAKERLIALLETKAVLGPDFDKVVSVATKRLRCYQSPEDDQ